MNGKNSEASVGVAVTVGLSSLAAALGIGRFAFTPLLPLMQETFGLTLTEGAWLAAANYLGYFVGGLRELSLESTGGPVRAVWLADRGSVDPPHGADQ
jgi:fucose permease